MKTTRFRSAATLATFAILLASCATPAPAHHTVGASGLGPMGGGTSLYSRPSGGGSGGGSGTVTSVSGTAPISVATGTTTPAISIVAATTSLAGSMSSTDKSRLNGLDTFGDWYATQANTVQAIDPTLTHCQPVNTRIGTAGATASTSGDWETVTAVTTGLFVPASDENGGVIVVKSGTNGTGLQYGQLLNSTNTNPTRIVANIKTSHWALVERLKVMTTIDANATMVFMSMNDFSTGYVALTLRGAISTANFGIFVNFASSTSLDTTQAVDTAGTTYHDVGMVFDGTTIWLTYDGVKVSTGLSTLTNVGTVAGGVRLFSVNGTTTVNREFRISRFAYCTAEP